jgi:hypothetical protein
MAMCATFYFLMIMENPILVQGTLKEEFNGSGAGEVLFKKENRPQEDIPAGDSRVIGEDLTRSLSV